MIELMMVAVALLGAGVVVLGALLRRRWLSWRGVLIVLCLPLVAASPALAAQEWRAWVTQQDKMDLEKRVVEHAANCAAFKADIIVGLDAIDRAWPTCGAWKAAGSVSTAIDGWMNEGCDIMEEVDAMKHGTEASLRRRSFVKSVRDLRGDVGILLSKYKSCSKEQSYEAYPGQVVLP